MNRNLQNSKYNCSFKFIEKERRTTDDKNDERKMECDE